MSAAETIALVRELIAPWSKGGIACHLSCDLDTYGPRGKCPVCELAALLPPLLAVVEAAVEWNRTGEAPIDPKDPEHHWRNIDALAAAVRALDGGGD